MGRNRPNDDASRRYHDRVASRYDAIYDDAFWEFHDELTWRLIKPHLPRDLSATCADLGCGTGKWGLKLLKSGFATTFVDNSAAMVGQVREKLETMGPKGRKGTAVVGDIINLTELPVDQFALVLAMGDPLSICCDAAAAAREMWRILKPGGVVIATVDNKLGAIDHYVERGNLDALEEFLKSGRTNWLTQDQEERFVLTTFTTQSLRQLFDRSGFEVLSITGKTIIPARQNRKLFEYPHAVDRLLRLEEDLARDPSSAGRAGHLQIAARRPASP